MPSGCAAPPSSQSAGWRTSPRAAGGVNAMTPDPVGGHIVRDANGAPTGILEDAAAALVTAKEPPYSDAQIESFILAGEAKSLASGVTSSQGGPVPLAVAKA